jgi:hypothetical protein
MVQAIDAQYDMPPLDAFPKSQAVTFKYYTGVMLFLREDYVQVYLAFHQRLISQY